MDDKQLKDILNDPQKLLNLFRLFHQMLHLYDEQEMKKELEKQEKEKRGTVETTGLGDTLSVVLTDKDGNVKQNINQ